MAPAHPSYRNHNGTAHSVVADLYLADPGVLPHVTTGVFFILANVPV